MSIAGQKRKRQQSSSDSPSTAKSPLTTPLLADVATTTSTHRIGNNQNYDENPRASDRRLGDQHPKAMLIRRSNLQRGAKDKVYAERLAAAGDFAAGCDIQIHKTVTRGSASSLVFTRDNGSHGDHAQSILNVDAEPKHARKSHSKNNTRRDTAFEISLSNQTLSKRKMDGTPLGWPFTDPAILSGKRSAPKSSKPTKQPQRMSFPSYCLKSKPSTPKREFMEDGHDLTVLTKKRQEESKSDTLETIRQSGDLTLHDKHKELSSSSSTDIATRRTESECTSVSCEENITRNNHMKCEIFEPDAISTKPTSPSSNRKKISYWTCNRCTLTNSNRRKKCEVCGNIRYLSMSSDGTLVLTDDTVESVNMSGIDLLRGSLSSECFEQGDFQCDALRESRATSNYTKSKTKFSPPNASKTEAQTSKAKCLLSEASPPLQDTSTQINNFFAIVSEPVSTRSTFKRLRLSQGMAQQKDEKIRSQQYLSKPACEERMHLESQASPDVREPRIQQCLNKKHDPNTNTSGFREWIWKRRSARRGKRPAKYSNAKAFDYGEMREIKVWVTLGEIGLNEKFTSTTRSVFALVSTVLLSRIRCSDVVDRVDVDRVESSQVSFRPSCDKQYVTSRVENDAQLANINNTDHPHENAHQPRLSLEGEMKLVRVKIYFGEQRVNKAKLWARIPNSSFTFGDSSSPTDCEILFNHQACTHDGINSSARTHTKADCNTSKPKRSELDSKVKFAGGYETNSDRSLEVDSYDISDIFSCVSHNGKCDSLVISDAEKNRHASVNRTGYGEYDEKKSLCSNQCYEIPRESCHNQRNVDGKFRYKRKLSAQTKNSQETEARVGGRYISDERHEVLLSHATYRNEGIDPDCALEKIKCNQRNDVTVTTSHDTERERAQNAEEKTLSPLAPIDCRADPVVVNTKAVSSQQPQWHAYSSSAPEDNSMDAGGEQINNRNAETTREIATCTTCTFLNGSVHYQQPFTPLTQQMQEFDYFSQASLGSHNISSGTKGIGSSCVKTLLGIGLETESSNKNSTRIKNNPTASATATPKILFKANKNLYNSNDCFSFRDDCFLEETSPSFEDTNLHPNVSNEKCPKLANNVDSFNLASHPYFPMFQTAGKKVTINVTAESLSKANKLLSHDFYEYAASLSVHPASATPAAMQNAKQGVYSEHQELLDDSQPSDSPSDHAVHMFETAGKKVAINVTAESPSKANRLLSHHLDEDAPSCSVPLASAFHAATNNAQSVNTKNRETTLYGHAAPMFQTAGKKVAINVTAESLSKANKLLSRDFYEYAASLSVHPASATRAAMQNAQKGENTEHHKPLDNSQPADSPSGHAVHMFETVEKNHAVNVTAESPSKANRLFSHDFYENAPSCSVPLASAFHAATNNAQSVNTNNCESTLYGHAFPVFQTAGKKVAINVTAESPSKANKLLSRDFYEYAASLRVHPASATRAAMKNAQQGVNTEYHEPLNKSQSVDSLSNHAVRMFETVGKKVAVNVTAESLSKANRLFSHHLDENAASCSVPLASSFPTAMNNAGGVNTENEMSSQSGHATPMFQTAEKAGLPKANLLSSHDFYENAASCSVPPASASPAATNNAQDINTDQEAPDNSESVNSSSDHFVPMFETAGKKVAINVTAESLSKANKLFSYDTCKEAVPCSVPPTFATHATENDAQSINIKNEETPDNSKSVDPPPDNACPMFETAGKKVAIDVTAESLSKADQLFSHGFYERAAWRSVPSASAIPAAINNSQDFNTDNWEASDYSKSMHRSCNYDSIVFQTAGKKIASNLTANSLSKAVNLFPYDLYEKSAWRRVPPGSAIPAATNCAQGANTENEEVPGNLKSVDRPPEHSVHMFQTARKKVAVNVTAESPSKANPLFSHNFTENTASCSVLPASVFPAAVNNSQGVNTEHQEAPDNSESVNSPSDHVVRMFRTAGKKVAINVTTENLSKADELLSHDLDDNAVSCRVHPESAFPADMNNAHSVDTKNEEAPDNSKLVHSSSDHDVLMFETAGEKVAINVTAESLSKATKLFSNDVYVLPASTTLAATNDAQVVNTDNQEAPDNSDSVNPPSNHAFPLFETVGKKVAINVMAESLSKPSKLFFLNLYKNASSCSVPPASTIPAAINNAPCVKTEDKELPDNSKLDDSSSDQAFPMFETARKNVTINVSAESLSKATKLFNNEVIPRTVTHIPKTPDAECLEEGTLISHLVGTQKPARVRNEIMNREVHISSEKQDRLTIHHDIMQKSNVDVKYDAPVQTIGQINFVSETTQAGPVLFSEKFLPSSTDSSPAKKVDETDLSLGDEADPTAIPSTDIPIPKQITRRFRHRKKVRFSLCPTDRSNLVVRAAGQITTSKENHRDFGGFSIKTVACDIPQSDVVGLFVTPDKRKPQHLVDEIVVNSQTKVSSNSAGDHLSENSRKGIGWSVPTAFSDEDDQIPSGSSPASDNLTCTPLQKMHNIHESQSEILSKRLFHSSTVDADTKSSISAPHVHEVMQNGSFKGNPKCCNKVKLGSFLMSKITRTTCKENGVNDITFRVTSTNANLLRFGRSDGLPSSFFGQSNVPKVDNIGKVSEIKSWLIEQNCDASLFTNKWIQNHQRWIVWKLAAMERSFPKELGGNYLVYSRVLRQIKERYEKELLHAKRPAVRKILNRDVSASNPVILCVSQILCFRSKASTEEDIRIELTDGWYPVPAALDTVLSQLVLTGRIKIGTKLMICNGQLLGSAEGVDPLDDSYSASKRDCPVCLSITANSTRLARWNAKLGFVSPRNPQLHSCSILVKSMRDVFIGGGPIPAIDVIICKRYPRMFLEQSVGNQDKISLHLTEAEDAARQIDHDTKHQRACETFADIAEKKCSKELDSDAPQQWKEMLRSHTPLEYYDKLDAADKKVVDDWSHNRAFLLQTMISKSVADSMRGDPSSERNRKPYVKVLVKSFCQQENTSDEPQKKGIAQASELTIWGVSDEQYNLVREGSVVRMKNLVVKSKDSRGILQLSANQETPMEALPNKLTYEQLALSGYERRCPKSLIQITLMAKQSGVAKIEKEFDVVACIVKVQKVSENTTIAYLTDESGLMVKLKRDHKADNIDPFSLRNSTLPTVVAFCNIRISSFDASDYCAVGAWGLQSCKSNHPMKMRYDYLNAWCSTNDGANCCRTVIDKINAGIPFGSDLTIKSKVCFGYILRFEGQQNPYPVPVINVIIDYGGKETVSARCPIDIVQHKIHLFQGASAESILGLNGLSSNKILLRFLLEEMSCYGGNAPILEVTDISLATIDELSRLYFSRKGDRVMGDGHKDPNKSRH